MHSQMTFYCPLSSNQTRLNGIYELVVQVGNSISLVGVIRNSGCCRLAFSFENALLN